ncbi:uncharacterized protein LAJ45_03848 [Morchella importuna]|uniref:uncharacterized protein n=1 Tax=Morchella importuna TaxID=1174673 RepID=UPI001E8DA72F|nr:uncharacterized protein LAJ45_03848 [Morchella importuna]KAH8151855.1 hypothetical protein LAJ45_03848 [Morchella importuna]
MVCCPIHLGQLFPSWADFKEAIQDWSIADKFQFKSLHKDRSRADIRCRTRTKKEPNHNCQRAERAAAKRETCNSQSWLKRHVPKHLIVTRETRPEEIQDVIKSYYGVDINYQAANDVKNTLSKQYKVKMVQPNLPAYLYPPHIDPHPNNDIGVWFKDASAAYLGRDSRQANSSTTTSNSFKRFFQQNSCIPSPSTIDTKDVEPNAKLRLSNPTREKRIHHCQNKDNIVTPISDSADEIILGAPIDQADLSKGFQTIQNQDKKRTTVQDAGLKDVSVIGYKVGEDADFSVEVPSDDFDDSQQE